MNNLRLDDKDYVRVNNVLSVYEADSDRFICEVYRRHGDVMEKITGTLELDDAVHDRTAFVSKEDSEKHDIRPYSMSGR